MLVSLTKLPHVTAKITVALLAICAVSTAQVVAQNPSVKKQVLADLGGEDLEGRDGPFSNLGYELAWLYRQHQEFQKKKAPGTPFQPQLSALPVHDRAVTVDFLAREGEGDALMETLRSLGAVNLARRERLISGRLPISALSKVARLKSLHSAEPAWGISATGEVDTQGDAAMRADDARTQSGYEGGGVTVGVLSDSYDQSGVLRSAQDDIDSGDLPSTSRIDILNDTEPGDDEGRAMMQIVHDVAPGANLAFHTAFGGRADFAQGIRELADAGSKVITDDIFYFAEPMFQDGVIAEAVEEVSQDGVAYFSAAGNRARQSHTEGFVSSGESGPNGGTLHDFGGGDTRQQVTIPTGEEPFISFQWVDPYGSVSSSGADTDLNIFLVDQSDSTVAQSAIQNVGGDPVEVIVFENDGSIDADNDGSPDTQFSIQIEHVDGPTPGRMTYIFGSGMSVDEYQSPGPSTFGHYNAEGSHSVAAAAYYNTPEFGTDPPQVESFSSEGGLPIYFDDNGNRLSSPKVRQVPDVTGPDGGNNTFFGSDSGADSDTYPNFFGTSAAAPHVAGVAALLLSKNPGLGPDQMYSALENTTSDMDNPATTGFDDGYDYRTGHGFVQADKAIQQVTEETPPAAPTGLTATSGDQQARLSWDANSESDLAGYNLYRSTSSFDDTTNATRVNGSIISGTSYTDSGLSNGTTYHYRVAAKDDTGIQSTPSKEVSVTIKQASLAITSLKPQSGAPGTTVRIYGSGFDPNTSGNSVKFGSTTAAVSRAETNVLYVSVPTGTGGGPAEVSVTSDGKAGTAIRKFDIVSGGDETFTDLGAGLGFISNASSSIADVDDDGRKDVLLAGETDAKLYTRNRDKSFSASQFERSTGVDGYSSSIGDITGNGRPDLVIANEGIFLQNQDGSFSLRRPELVSGGANSLGDFNEDGKLDLLVAGFDSTSTPSASAYLQDQNGNFNPSNAGLKGVYDASASVGDVNGDGHLDILITGDSTEAYDKRTPATLLYLGDGSGDFKKASADLVGVWSVRGKEATSIADVNGDGDLDLVITGYDANRSGTTLLYLQNEDGSFSPANAGLTDLYGLDSAVSTGDINGDGNTDILLVGYDGDKSVVHFYIQGDNGGFRRANAGIPGSASGSPSISDFDGDGELDVLLAGENRLVGDTLTTTLYGNGPDTVPPWIPSNLTRSAGNQKVSLSWEANTENDLAGYNVYRSTSAINDTTDATLINNQLIEEAGYIDSDVSNGTTYHYRVTAVDNSNNQGLPTEEVTATPSGNRQLTSFVETGINVGDNPVATWGDYDGDGDLDIFVCCSALYRNDGRWDFTKVDAGIRDFPAVIGDDAAGSADWGDFDGDGDLDLVIAGYEAKRSGTVEIYRNEGDSDSDGTVEFVQVEAGLSSFSGGGDFGTIVGGPPLGGMKRPSSQWGDYNNDGDLDLVVTGSRSATIYRNDGDGTFTDINAGLKGVDWGTSQWGDYDSDGDLDLVITGSPSTDSRITRIYENRGGGDFQPIDSDIPGVVAGFSEWGDYDNDGDLDLAIGGGIQGETIYENKNGSFTKESLGTPRISFPARWTGSASWADYDQDGDLDLFVSGYPRDLQGTFQDGDKQDALTLYKNQGNGQFTYLTYIRERTPPRSSSEWGDYDGDGDPDLLLAGDRTEILQNGIPKTVGIEFQRTFSDASDSEDYRLVGLPGGINRPFDDAINGEAGVSWQAYWDSGSSIVEYDGSSDFRFQPGRGFWLTSTEEWTVEDSVESVLTVDSFEKDEITIPLHNGWNIISNPLGLSRPWSQIQTQTGSNLQPLWAFNGSYRQVDTLRSAKTGRAYYFYNDEGLSSLKIPTPGAPTAPPVRKRETQKETSEQDSSEMLTLSAFRSGPENSKPSTVRFGITEGAEESSNAEKIVAPPGRFEDVSLRILDSKRPDTSRSRFLMTDRLVSEKKEGHTFTLFLSTREKREIQLTPNNLDALGKREASLLSPTAGKSYNLRKKEKITLEPSKKQIELRLAIGSKQYVDEKREEVTPESINLTSYPNPVKERATIRYSLPEPQPIQLVLYDILGRKVGVLARGKKEAGHHRVQLRSTDLSSGVYFGRLTTGEQIRTQKITVVR